MYRQTSLKSVIAIVFMLVLVLSLRISIPLVSNSEGAKNISFNSVDSSSVFAETDNWIKSYDGGAGSSRFESVIAAADGGYIAVGYTLSRDRSAEFIIAKFDEKGNKVWIKDYGWAGNDTLYSVTPAPDGGYVAVGQSYADVGTDGKADFIIAKFDENGNDVWINKYSAGGYSNYEPRDRFNCVTPAPNGGYLAVGYSDSNTNYQYNKNIIAKFDEDGNQVWIKEFGDKAEYASEILSAPGGGYIVGSGKCLSKFDENGHEVWIKSTEGKYSLSSIIHATGGGYIIVGTDGRGITNYDPYDAIIAKLDESGNDVWVKKYSDETKNDYTFVTPASEGGYVALGNYGTLNSDLNYSNITKFDENGDRVWVKKYNDRQIGQYGEGWISLNSIIPVSDGGYISVGSLDTGGGPTHFLIAKFDKDGNLPVSAPVTKQVTVTFDTNDGKVLPASLKTKRVIIDTKYGTLPTPKRVKYIFKGWFTAKSGGAKITPNSTVTIIKNVTLYAQWTKVNVVKASIKSLKNSKKKTMTVTLKKIGGAEGYQVSYSNNKKFKKVKTTTTTALTKNIKKLKKGETYYVKVRAYKYDSTGAKVYGKYSNTKKIKIKK